VFVQRAGTGCQSAPRLRIRQSARTHASSTKQLWHCSAISGGNNLAADDRSVGRARTVVLKGSEGQWEVAKRVATVATVTLVESIASNSDATVNHAKAGNFKRFS
jgi:hypothetical protein